VKTRRVQITYQESLELGEERRRSEVGRVFHLSDRALQFPNSRGNPRIVCCLALDKVVGPLPAAQRTAAE